MVINALSILLVFVEKRTIKIILLIIIFQYR